MSASAKPKARKFFSPGPASDPTYEFCLNEPQYATVRDRIEAMWAKYEPYCPDTNFLTEARSHFVERTWEMRLGCVLLERGFPLAYGASREDAIDHVQALALRVLADRIEHGETGQALLDVSFKAA